MAKSVVTGAIFYTSNVVVTAWVMERRGNTINYKEKNILEYPPDYSFDGQFQNGLFVVH